MPPFRQPDQAKSIKDRLNGLATSSLDGLWQSSFDQCPDPDRAIINLERWLDSTSNPGTILEHLAQVPRLAGMLIQLLGSSQSISDALIQNPELASIVTDPAEVAREATADSILAEGKQLLSHANTYSHKLDRLRYLKQRWRLPIVVNDLAAAWSPEKVWRAISDVADAIVQLAVETVWQEYAAKRSLTGDCPLMVVAFGKLGGHELNYSSDIDLVYVLSDGMDENFERHAGRFCEMLGDALSASMGRGSLYRVDLRLRPFGSSGPISPSMASVEAYYRSHAELWEAQALIRSRPIAGNLALARRWEDLVYRHCFRKSTSELAVNTILETRDRIEGMAPESDFKRGSGGIRDVEFLTQLLQMLHGFAHPEVRMRPTLNALRALSSAGYLSESHEKVFESGYTFLRQLEHRCQLIDDQQTHALPKSQVGKCQVARMMEFEDPKNLEGELSRHRGAIREAYNQELKRLIGPGNTRDALLSRLAPPLRSGIEQWFDRLPESEQFYRCLTENAQSLGRVTRIVEDAPTLVSGLAETVSVTEEIVSGEIEEAHDSRPALAEANTPEKLSAHALALWRQTVASWVVQPEEELGPRLSALCDAVVRGVRNAVGGCFDIVALGSYGLLDMAIHSDLDILLLASDMEDHTRCELQAQQFLKLISEMKRYGWPAGVDLRLRPEGRQGLLVRTHTGLRNYELERMQMWERFALGQARLIAGRESSLEIALHAAYALPLTPERLKELTAMKHRVETERVMPQYWKRDLKLGYGGLSDIEWFTHLHEMRYPTALEVGRHVSLRDRLRRMAKAGIINALEFETLIQARVFLLETRNRLVLLGFAPDVVPENPDKLERLARSSRMASGYDFQRKHEQVIQSVRTIYEEGLERLGV